VGPGRIGVAAAAGGSAVGVAANDAALLNEAEVEDLAGEAVDLTSATMHVIHELQRIGGELRLVEVKTRGSHRMLHLPGSILAELREHRQRQIKEQLAAGYWEESGFVFTTGHGLPLDGDRLRRHFLVPLAKAGLRHMRFYDLRRSCASLLLAQGVPLRSIMELLGHSSIALTANTYTHLLPALQKETAQAWDRLAAGFGQPKYCIPMQGVRKVGTLVETAISY